MPANGVVQGMRLILFYNYGTKENERMNQTLKAAFFTIGTIMIAGTLLFFMLRELILSMFHANNVMLKIGISGLKILSLSFVLSAGGIVMAGVFESFGQGKQSLLISLLRQFVIIIPLSFILTSKVGINGVWMTFPLSKIIASVFHSTYIKHYISR